MPNGRVSRAFSYRRSASKAPNETPLPLSYAALARRTVTVVMAPRDDSHFFDLGAISRWGVGSCRHSVSGDGIPPSD